MSYVQRRLVNDKSEIIQTYRITKWILFNELFLLILTLGLFVGGFFIPGQWHRFWNIAGNVYFGLFNIIGGLLSAVVLVALLVELIKRASVEIVLTRTRLIGKKGVLRIEVLDRQLTHIDFVKVRLPIIGRIFGFGHVTIGSNNKEYVYKKVARPIALQREYNKQLDARNSQNAPQ